MGLLPLSGSPPVSQRFNDSCCRAAYQKFSLLGHDGEDFAVVAGTPVYAPDSGTVGVDHDPNGYGDNIQITVPDGSFWLLGHLSRMDVSGGQWVTAGDQIALSGGHPGAPGAGNSNGDHLHLSFGAPGWQNNQNNGFAGFADPEPHLNGTTWDGTGAQPHTPFPIQRMPLLIPIALAGAGVALWIVATD